MTRDRYLRLLVGLLIVLPAVVAIGATVRRPWHPVDDFAIIDLRVRDLWSMHTPLTGLYTRPGWNHPGPLMFYFIGVVSSLAGNAPWATRVGGTLMQLVALVWLAWVTMKHSLGLLLAAGAVTALTYLGIATSVLQEPWNPYIPLPWFVLFVFVTHLAATGSFRQLIAMSIAGTIMVQTHVSYVVLVIAGFAWTIVCVVVDHRRTHAPPDRWRSTLAVSAAIWIVSWIAPLIGVVVNTPGNLGLLVRYFLSGSHPSVGLSPAVGIMASEFRPLPPWLGGHDRLVPFSSFAVSSSPGWLLIPCGLLILGFVVARRSRQDVAVRAVGLAALFLVVGIVAISRADEPRAYTFEWRVTVASFVVVASIWAIASAVPAQVSRFRAATITLVVAVVIWGSVVRAVPEASDGHDPLAAREPVLTELMKQVGHRDLPKHQIVLVRSDGTALPSLYDGVIDALDRIGIDVRVDPGKARIFGSHRVASAARANEVWYVIERGALLPTFTKIPGAQVIASFQPLDRADDDELARIQHDLGGQLLASGHGALVADLDSGLIAAFVSHVKGIDQGAAARLAQLNQEANRDGGCRCAIVSVPGG